VTTIFHVPTSKSKLSRPVLHIRRIQRLKRRFHAEVALDVRMVVSWI